MRVRVRFGVCVSPIFGPLLDEFSINQESFPLDCTAILITEVDVRPQAFSISCVKYKSTSRVIAWTEIADNVINPNEVWSASLVSGCGTRLNDVTRTGRIVKTRV